MTMRRALGYLLFVLLVPGTGGVYVPWFILTGGGAMPEPTAWPAAVLIGAGLVLDIWCFWVFAIAGRGTPATWDAPRQVVAVGPYRWVRNPIYIGALLAVVGEAWLFLSLPLLAYAIVLAVGFHLLVVGYEEPTLRGRFGEEYERYRRAVPRWVPRLPRWWNAPLTVSPVRGVGSRTLDQTEGRKDVPDRPSPDEGAPSQAAEGRK